MGLLVVQLWKQFRSGSHEKTLVSVDFSIGIASLYLTGIAVNGLLLTLLGVAGLLQPVALLFMLLPGIAGLVLSRSYLTESLLSTGRWFATWKTQPVWLQIISGCSVLLALSFAVGAWILPPKGDAAAFYMVYPKIMAATARLEPMHGPFEFFSTIGLPAELHYTALMILADEHAAKLFMFPVALTVGVMLAGIVRLCGGGSIATTLGWAMLLSSYTYYHYIFDGKVDLVAAAFGLAAVYWFLWINRSALPCRVYGIAGWFAGLATVAKFSYLLVLGTSMTVLLVWGTMLNRSQSAFRKETATESIAETMKVGMVMGVAAIISWLPQLLKNFVLFEAPLAPFLGLEGDSDWLAQVWFSPQDTIKILLTYPLALVFGRYPMQGGGLSFLFITFVPFLFWLARPANWRQSTTTAVTLAALVAVISWMLLRPTVIAPRYILAPLLLFVPILVLAVESVVTNSAENRGLGAGIVLSVLLAFAASLWHLLPIPRTFATAMAGQDVTCLLASGECTSLEMLSDLAEPGERALVASYYPYWLTPALLQCRDVPEEQRNIPERRELVSWLQRQGFSYVAVDPSISGQLDADLDFLAQTDSLNVEQLYTGAVLNVYRIRQNNTTEVNCIESSPGRWSVQGPLS